MFSVFFLNDNNMGRRDSIVVSYLPWKQKTLISYQALHMVKALPGEIHECRAKSEPGEQVGVVNPHLDNITS